MNKLTIIIAFLLILGIGSVAYTIINFVRNNKSTTVVNNEANYKKYASAELSDKCKTPPGYTDKSWAEHMSHHPENYKECFTNKIKYKNIKPTELSAMLTNKDFILIDVHIPEQSHITSTDKLIPYNKLIEQKLNLPKDKNTKIVLYCRSGSMSETAAGILVSLGYTNVYNLEGGANAWQSAGYKLEKIVLLNK